MTEPTKIQRAIALNGLKTTTIPILDPALGDGKACYDKGFGLLNFTPKTSGGIPPWGVDMNGFLYDLSSSVKFLNSGGIFVYDAAHQTAIGGYPIGALIRKADLSGYWMATTDNNMTNPNTGGAGWSDITPKWFATAGGTTSAYTATTVPAFTALSHGMTVVIDTTSVGTNAIVAPTFSVNGLTAYAIVKTGGALRVANMPKFAQLQYNATLTQWILLNPDESRSAVPVGTIFPYTGSSTVAPAGYIFDGSVLNRTTYADLYALWVTSQGFTAQTFTVTIAAPGVFTKASHGFNTGERLRLFTTGALPTGLNTTTDYFVEKIDANTFYLTTSKFGYATRITTTGTQSGTHTYLQSLYGLGDGSTTFNAPNIADLFIRGLSASGRLMGTMRKGTLIVSDTSDGTVNDPAVVTLETLALTLAQQNSQIGFETYTTTDYPNVTMNSAGIGATGIAIPGAGLTGVTSSPAIPPHISFPHIIKY